MLVHKENIRFHRFDRKPYATDVIFSISDKGNFNFTFDDKVFDLLWEDHEPADRHLLGRGHYSVYINGSKQSFAIWLSPIENIKLPWTAIDLEDNTVQRADAHPGIVALRYHLATK